MKKIAILLSLIVSVGAQTDVSGIISKNTTWAKSNSPYNLSDDVQVAYGNTLTIEPGTNVNGNYNKLMIFGKLSAIGTETDLITFDSVLIGPSSSNQSELHEIHIEYANVNKGSIYSQTGNPYGHFIIRDSKIKNLDRYTYLWRPTADCYIERNVFLNTPQIKINTRDTFKVVIKNNFFRNDFSSNALTTGYAIDIYTQLKYPSYVSINHNTFFNTDKIALSVSVGGTPDELDAKQNYWNTTDETVIQSMINDRNDDLNASLTVQYSPYLEVEDESTPYDVPQAFEWLSSALDTINITQANGGNLYEIEWTKSKYGNPIAYLIYAQIGVNAPYEIFRTATTSFSMNYKQFHEGSPPFFPSFFENIPGNAATVRFSVYAHDGTDSVKVTGDDRVIYVNRYDYLSVDGEGVPSEFALHENYPNPFNPSTTLRFDLPELSDMNVIIYNMLGQKVKTFNMNDTPAGYHAIKWDATNDYGDPVGAGMYLYQLRANEFVKTKKMVLLK